MHCKRVPPSLNQIVDSPAIFSDVANSMFVQYPNNSRNGMLNTVKFINFDFYSFGRGRDKVKLFKRKYVF